MKILIGQVNEEQHTTFLPAGIYIIPVKMQTGGWKLAIVTALGSRKVLKCFKAGVNTYHAGIITQSCQLPVYEMFLLNGTKTFIF